MAGIHRIGDGPVVAYGSVPGYGPIFNAGAVFHDGRFHLFARAVREAYRRNEGSGARFLNYVSDILVFTSEDGRRYSFQQVLAEGATNGIYAWEDPRVHVVTLRRGRNGHFVMSYTNLPPPETKEFWRIGIHRLAYADGRFSLDDSSGRVIGPPGEPDKDGIVFNLRDGRVALIHRIYPNMQLAIFDSLAELFDPPAGYWEAHMAELERHIDHPAAPDGARSRGRRAAGRDARRPASALPRARRERALQHEGGAARSRDRPGEVGAREADHEPRAGLGAGR